MSTHHNHSHEGGRCHGEHEDDELDKLLSQESMMVNIMNINYVRSLMAIVGGLCAGILGLTSLYGLAFYVTCHVLTSLALLNKMKFQLHDFAPNTASDLKSIITWAFKGMGEQALSFILFWTLSVAVVHIY
jgi:hypothetical protein